MKKVLSIFTTVFIFSASCVWAEEPTIQSDTPTEASGEKAPLPADNGLVLNNDTALDNASVLDNGMTSDSAPVWDNITTSDNATLWDNATTLDNVTSSSGFIQTTPEDRLKKFYVTVGYSGFAATDKIVSEYLKDNIGVNIGYNFGKYFGVEAGFGFLSGSRKYTATTPAGDVSVKGDLAKYDIKALLTFRYPFELGGGSLTPYLGAGVTYSFGDLKKETTVLGVMESKSYSGGTAGFNAKLGVRYYIGMFIIGVNVDYIYNEFSLDGKMDFSGFGYGAELGIRF